MKKIIIVGASVITFLVIISFLIISILPRQYSIKKDGWEKTEYVALNYGKYLGKKWDNGTYSYYQIKGFDENEWIYEGYGSIIPMNYWTGKVYKKNNLTIEPLEQWNVNQILITSSSDIKQGKVSYSINNIITDKNIINKLLGVSNNSSGVNMSDLTIDDHQLLFVFEEYPSLAWKCQVFSDKSENYFILKDNHYYSANFLKNYME